MMIILSIFCVLLELALHASAQLSSNVVDTCSANCGVSTTNSKIPCWHVGLVDTSNSRQKLLCTGALISSLEALLPAQCVARFRSDSDALQNLKIFAGIRDGFSSDSTNSAATTKRGLSQITIHASYFTASNATQAKHTANIAIIQLDSPVNCNNGNVCAVCLPQTSTSTRQRDGNNCHVSSWNNNSAALSTRPVQIIPNSDCEQIIRNSKAVNSDYTLTRGRLCAQEEEQQEFSKCPGNVGDPLVCGGDANVLYGLNVMGASCVLPSELPSEYVNIQHFLPWIAMHSLKNTAAADVTTTSYPTTADLQQHQGFDTANGVLVQKQLSDFGTNVQVLKVSSPSSSTNCDPVTGQCKFNL